MLVRRATCYLPKKLALYMAGQMGAWAGPSTILVRRSRVRFPRCAREARTGARIVDISANSVARQELVAAGCTAGAIAGTPRCDSYNLLQS